MGNPVKLFLVIVVFTYGCYVSDNSVMSESDIIILYGMELSFDGATEALTNARTAILDGSADSVVYYHDSIFHEREDEFKLNHKIYSHQNKHDDHFHNVTGMHTKESYNIHDGWNDSHPIDDHYQMDELVKEHVSLELH